MAPTLVRVPSSTSSRAARSEATNARASSAPPPSRRRRTSALPTITPSQLAAASRGLGRRRDADTEQHRQVGDRPCSRRPICSAWEASCSRSPVTPRSDTPYTNPCEHRQICSRRSSVVVGAASSTVSICSTRAASAHPSSSSSGRSGRIAASTPARAEIAGEPLVPVAGDEVVVRHHDERYRRVETPSTAR